MINKKEIPTAAIFCCISHGELGKAITKSTDGTYSHTAEAFWDRGVLYIIDAQSGGVAPRTWEYWNNKYKYDYVIFENPLMTNPDNFIRYKMQFSGVGYDKKGLGVGLLKSLILNSWFRRFLKKETMSEKFRNNGLFWCSEYTMKDKVADPEQYTPQKVYDYCIKNNFKIIGTNINPIK